jgi:hypothetical protein
MAGTRVVRSKRILMGRLSHGEDLLGGITDTCTREGIYLGRVEALGAVQRARLGYYHQLSREYRFLALNEPLELICLCGNVSIRDGDPFVHAHVTLSDSRGRAFGGHLAEGTVVFACEFVIESLEGSDFVRERDSLTGLHLWTSPL